MGIVMYFSTSAPAPGWPVNAQPGAAGRPVPAHG